jgi:DNA repair exonuclease SbcCD ATPase subunit
MSDDMGELVEDMQAERSEAESEVIRLRADLEKMTGERDELRGELEAESIRRLNQLDELRELFEAMRDWRDNMMRQRDEAIARAENAANECNEWRAAVERHAFAAIPSPLAASNAVAELCSKVADLTEQLAGHVQQHAIEAACLAEARRENAEVREALTKCANLTRHQENSPSTVWEVGLRVNAIVAAALARNDARKDGG